jgi:hypothetical protein
MSVQLLEIPGAKIKIPCCQYVMNERQQFVVLAIDFDKSFFTLGYHEGIEYIPMGKLNEQNFIFESRVINSLRIDGWDFDSYPNPEIVLIQSTGDKEDAGSDVEIISPQEDLFEDDQEDEDDEEIPVMPWEQYNDLWDPVPERKCRQCGCTENDACVHPKYGPCWWVEDDLCSHCKNWPGQSTRPNSIIL